MASEPPPAAVHFETDEYHTGGEPFRIVAAGAVVLDGVDVADKRVRAINNEQVQFARALLCSEPRGHADMYGGFITAPNDEGADLGVLFWHKDGFSTACGHGTIALGVWAVETGLVPSQASGTRDVRIDVPSGRVTARVAFDGGVVTRVSFVNVPSWVHATDVVVDLEGGQVTCDIAFGGAMYAIVPVAAVGLRVHAIDLPDLIRIGRRVRNALNDIGAANHPSDERLSGVYGVIFTEAIDPADPADPASGATVEGLGATGALHQRNVTIFADGEVDRSPCGSGTAARVAHLVAQGQLKVGERFVHDSIVGSRFHARAVEQVEADGHQAVVAEVTGTAHRTGRSSFTVDPHDSLVPGFVLR